MLTLASAEALLLMNNEIGYQGILQIVNSGPHSYGSETTALERASDIPGGEGVKALVAWCERYYEKGWPKYQEHLLAAIRSLGKTRDLSASSLLLRAVRDQNDEVRETADAALTQLGYWEGKTFEDLTLLLTESPPFPLFKTILVKLSILTDNRVDQFLYGQLKISLRALSNRIAIASELLQRQSEYAGQLANAMDRFPSSVKDNGLVYEALPQVLEALEMGKEFGISHVHEEGHYERSTPDANMGNDYDYWVVDVPESITVYSI